MIMFVIKYILCLAVFYGFYYLLLRNIKAFNFNRIYLLFSMIFGLVISLTTIRLNLPLSIELFGLSNVSDTVNNEGEVLAHAIHFSTFQKGIIMLYFTISFILLLRFVVNIYHIIKLIRTNTTVNNLRTKIVLIDKQTLPYSFFKYIFINRSDYEKNKIENELIIHEEAHCIQYHSFDILLIELIKIFLWFNPLVWIFSKAIKLNHEYLADKNVLSKIRLDDYQNIIANHVFRNNSTYLASNFNFSLTKKRLIMMTKKKLKTTVLRKIIAIPMFLFIGLVIANAQDSSEKKEKQIQETVIPPPVKRPPPPPPTPVKRPPPPPPKRVNQVATVIPPPPPPVKSYRVVKEVIPPPPPPVKKD